MRKIYNNLRGAGKSMVSGGENMIQRKKYNFGDLPALFEHEVVKSDAACQEMAHWHNDVELIRVITGKLHCHVNHSDFLLHPGELCFINLRQLHRVYNTEKEPCELEVLTVSPELFSQNKKLYKTYILPVINDESFTHVRVEGKNGFVKIIERMMDELQEIAAEKPVGYELEAAGYIHLIFRRLYMIYSEPREQPPLDNDVSLQRRMTAYIYEHYSEKITLEDIARSGAVSPSKCAALFRKYTQKSPVNFLISYRLEMGSKLLNNTGKAISEIAQDCGFAQQSYFNRMFLREFGCTPKEWRKRTA